MSRLRMPLLAQMMILSLLNYTEKSTCALSTYFVYIFHNRNTLHVRNHIARHIRLFQISWQRRALSFHLSGICNVLGAAPHTHSHSHTQFDCESEDFGDAKMKMSHSSQHLMPDSHKHIHEKLVQTNTSSTFLQHLLIYSIC